MRPSDRPPSCGRTRCRCSKSSSSSASVRPSVTCSAQSARSLRVTSGFSRRMRLSAACTAGSGPRSWRMRRACRTYQSLRLSCSSTSLLRRQLLQIDLDPLVVDVADLEDAPERLLVELGIAAVALVLVVPVDHVDAAVGAVAEVEHLAPRVVGQQEVRAVRGDVARALPLQPIGVGAAAVDVVHEDRLAVLARPGVAAEVDHRPGVGVAAAGRCRAAVAGVRSLAPDPVDVVGDGLDVVVDVRVEVLAGLPLVSRALDDVVQVLDDARGRERLAVVVEVEAPRIARALGEDLEDVLGRMVAPDRAVERAGARRRARRACRRSSG